MTPLELISLLLNDYTLRTVALGTAVLGIVSGVLSTYTVLRKQSLLGDAMSHAALPGVVLAFMITGQKGSLALMLGAALACWLGALFVMLIVRETRIKQDAAFGIVLAVFFGLGITLLSWVQRQDNANQAGLDKFLFGRAAALVESDVLEMAVIGLIALVLVLVFWKEFKLLAFDPAYAFTLGMPVRALDIALTSLVVVAVVIGLQTVGVVLMSAMLVAPGSAARQWTNRLGVMTVLSALFGGLAGVSGALASSVIGKMPTGPAIVIAATVIVMFSLLFAPNRGLVWESVRNMRRRRQLRSGSSMLQPDARSVTKEAFDVSGAD